MSPLEVASVCANLSRLSLGPATALPKGVLKKCALTYEERPLSLRLEGEVVFEPSVYQGTGDEARKGIVLRLSSADFTAFQALEEWCKQALLEQTPNVDGIWSDSSKLTEKWGAQLKAKINVHGPYCAIFYDESRQPCKAPQVWKGLLATVLLEVRGCYVQRNSAGLLLEVTHLRYGEPPEAAEVECPI